MSQLEMILRSMVADQRSQGWSISDSEADEKVAKLRNDILATAARAERTRLASKDDGK
jgi:hypothetical protein